MNYLKSLWGKYKIRKQYMKAGMIDELGFLPSITYTKYPLNTSFGGKRVLNIGCGLMVYKTSNVVNTDLYPGSGVNIVCDLSKTPLPFKDNEFDYIIANHVLEHIPNWFECFKELARVVKPGGIIEVWIPSVSSDGAFVYRDHVNYMGYHSFMGIQEFARPGSNLAAKQEINQIKLEEVTKLRTIEKQRRLSTKWWIYFAPDCLTFWMSDHLRNIVSEEGYFFKKGE